ncbi:MAG TPA: AAA family ATPase [Anaerolineales bacterium]|nr:AAA family ATPase [Anaerolineales bacterium]
MDATKPYPYAMIDEVNNASVAPPVDREEKDRILYRLKDVIQPPPPREWVVDGILSRSSLNLLVGNPGSKKTYMAVDLAFCVAMGRAIGVPSSPAASSPLARGACLERSEWAGEGRGVRGFHDQLAFFRRTLGSRLRRALRRLQATLPPCQTP